MKQLSKIFYISILLYTLHTHNSAAQLVPDFRVNDDTTNQAQFGAALDIDSMGNFVVVWRDERNGKLNIYCQRFNSLAQIIGQNFKVNINPDSSYSPNLAVARNGNFGVCWMEGTVQLILAPG